MILKCTCSHKYQDQKYGPGQRVHNPSKGNNDQDVRWTCTVCGTKK